MLFGCFQTCNSNILYPVCLSTPMVSNFFLSAFLRSVAYREFIRMVYGILGKRRVPLPAFAYHQIRKTFPVVKGEQHILDLKQMRNTFDTLHNHQKEETLVNAYPYPYFGNHQKFTFWRDG